MVKHHFCSNQKVILTSASLSSAAVLNPGACPLNYSYCYYAEFISSAYLTGLLRTLMKTFCTDAMSSSYF